MNWRSGLRGILLALGLSACGRTAGTEGRTRWLDPCAWNAECSGGLSCLCGVCTKVCRDGTDCSGLGGPASCVDLHSLPGACGGTVFGICGLPDGKMKGPGVGGTPASSPSGGVGGAAFGSGGATGVAFGSGGSAGAANLYDGGSRGLVDAGTRLDSSSGAGGANGAGGSGGTRTGGLVFVAKGPYSSDFAITQPAPPGSSDPVHGVADDLCTQAARAAGLHGTYRAWISSSRVDAYEYFTQQRMNGPWYRADGLLVASGRAELIGGTGLENPILLAPNGRGVGPTYTWTGTYKDGTVVDNCGDFSSQADWAGYCGSPGSAAADWGGQINIACAGTAGLFCFEDFSADAGVSPDLNGTGGASATPAPDGGTKLVFIAKGPYLADFVTTSAVPPDAPDRLHAAADDRCMAAAAAAGKTGTFRAWISSSKSDAYAYFEAVGLNGPWDRSDGVRVANDRLTLISTSGLLAPVLLAPDGRGVGPICVWSGTSKDGTVIDNCADFTSVSAWAGYCGLPDHANEGWSGESNMACGGPGGGLYCFEE